MIFARVLPSALLLLTAAGAQTAPSPSAAASPMTLESHAQAHIEIAATIARARTLTDLNRAPAPYHLIASIEIVDRENVVRARAKIDQVWIAPDQYRRTISLSTLATTLIRTPQALWQTDPANNVPSILRAYADGLLSPFAALDTSPATELTRLRSATPTGPVTILTSDRSQPPSLPDFDRYSITAGGSLQRRDLPWKRSIVFEDVRPFAGQRIPWRVSFYRNGILTGRILIKQLTPLSETPDLSLPPTAVPAPPVIDEALGSEGVIRSYLPEPPSFHGDIAGGAVQVRVGVIVAPDGHVRDVSILYAGTPYIATLTNSALRDWLFKPFIIDGKPTEIATMLTLNYSRNGNRDPNR